MEFENIKNINIADASTWKEKVFLTFDVEWAADGVLAHTLDIVERYDIKVTFFHTHETKLTERMRENPKVELGIHPNFNPMLMGDLSRGKNIDDIVENCLKIAEEAVSVRSHSQTQNSHILDSFVKHGMRFEVNSFIPINAGMVLKPWLFWNGMMAKVPYFWEDDIHCIQSVKGLGGRDNALTLLNYEGIKVFDFHPIHVFLNTERIARYERCKNDYSEFQKLLKHRNCSTYGIYNYLIELIEEVAK